MPRKKPTRPTGEPVNPASDALAGAVSQHPIARTEGLFGFIDWGNQIKLLVLAALLLYANTLFNQYALDDDVVIVRNPPGYYLASNRRAVVLPFGDESTLLAVAEKFHAKYLVLEKNGTFDAIQNLYDDPNGNPSFTYLGEVDGARLYRIEIQN